METYNLISSSDSDDDGDRPSNTVLVPSHSPPVPPAITSSSSLPASTLLFRDDDDDDEDEQNPHRPALTTASPAPVAPFSDDEDDDDDEKELASLASSRIKQRARPPSPSAGKRRKSQKTRSDVKNPQPSIDPTRRVTRSRAAIANTAPAPSSSHPAPPAAQSKALSANVNAISTQNGAIHSNNTTSLNPPVRPDNVHSATTAALANAATPGQFVSHLGCNPRMGLCSSANPATCPVCSAASSANHSDITALAQPPKPNSSSAAAVVSEGSKRLSNNPQSDDGDSDAEMDPSQLPANPIAPEPAISTKMANDLIQLNHNCGDATRESPTPVELTVPLLTHQRQALRWMCERERVEGKPEDHPRGGILADDQGFGKTLSLISLMITNRSERETNSNERVAWGNLIVAPTSILRQWAGEIFDRIEPRYRPSVLIYHGHQRVKDPYELVKYDIVITSYGVLVQEYPKEYKELDQRTNKFIKRSRRKGPLFRVNWHRVILDEAQAIKNRQSESHRASVALEANCRWVVTGTPIQNTIDDLYSLFLFLGYYVVQTYVEWKKKYKSILEGSVNERRRERAFKAFQLLLAPVLLRRAKHDKIRGKPIIPLPKRTVRVLELKFTKTEREYYQAQEVAAVQRMNIMADELYSGQAMAIALVILLRLRQACNHPKLCEWNSEKQFTFSEDELDVMDVRMKTVSLFKKLLPEVQTRLYNELGPESTTPHTCPICMDVVVTDGIVTKCGHVFCKADFDEWANSNDSCPSCRTPLGDGESMHLDVVRKEVHAMERQKKREEEVKDESVPELEPVKRENDIAAKMHGVFIDISDEEPDEVTCGPKRRRLQNGTWVESKKENMEVNMDEGLTNQRPIGNNEDDEVDLERDEEVLALGTSTKIRTFMQEFRNIVETTEDKVLCFSQWTRMLELVSQQVTAEGFEFVQLDGSQSLEERAQNVKMFQQRSKCRLFLISLKAGSTGLNLTVANRVFLLDSWWNPAVEDQAIDRVHRIGQVKDVEVIKLKIENSVEERIFKLQEKKRQIADGALGKEGLKMMGRQRLTMREVLGLFEDVYENVAQRAVQQSDSALVEIVQTVVENARSFERGLL